MRKLFKEFKQFISKGNIIDLAIAVVIGNAFNKIVNSLVNSVIMPFIGYLTGGASVADWKWVIREAVYKDGVQVVAENSVQYGIFLQAIIDFLIIALCLFFAMKIVTYSRKRIEKTKNILKKELKELNKWDKKRLKKQGINIEELSGEGTIEDLIKKSQTAQMPKLEPEPSKEEKLLTEIRDLLAVQYGSVTTQAVAEGTENVEGAESEETK